MAPFTPLFSLSGPVVRGFGNGGPAGMPTANLSVDAETISRLPGGVYATVVLLGEQPFLGVTNIGRRPSVDASDLITVETFFPDYTGDLYGKTLTLFFLLRLRDTKKFASLAEVTAQVARDIEAARAQLFPLPARAQLLSWSGAPCRN